MENAATQTDLLIVGAGPVGLFLANECARRGISSRIVEANSTQSEHSKALAIFPRTLEVFDMAGLAAPFLKAANRVTSVSVMTRDRTLAHMKFSPEDSPYPFVAMVPQNVTEKLLADALHSRGLAVEYETSFVSAVQKVDQVTVTLDHKGQRQEVTAKFVVGCDGAHSTVRHLLDLPFEGAQYHDLFLLADVDTNGKVPSDELLLCPNESGPLALFPMDPIRFRIVATIQEAEGEAPSLELVQKILDERAPSGIEVHTLHWSSYFRIHHRHVAQLRMGRMFLAGDAAHIHSPFGGQGMNTGLQDIWNLVWKLDLFLRGHGNDRLLESYTAERLPVIRQVIETTDFLTKALGTPRKLPQLLRNAIIPMVSRLAPFQHAFVQRLSELGIAYGGSPIVEGPGKRYWDDSVRGGNGIGSRFLLVIDHNAEPSTTKAAGELVACYPDIVELRYGSNPEPILVRPDGYIAYSAHGGKRVSAFAEIRAVLDGQTQADPPGSAGTWVA